MMEIKKHTSQPGKLVVGIVYVCLCLFAFCLASTLLQAQSRQPMVFAEVARFQGGQPVSNLLEVHLSVHDTSLSPVAIGNNRWRTAAAVRVEIAYTGTDKPLVENTFILEGEIIRDTSPENRMQYLSHLLRYPLNPGNYTLTLFVADGENPDKETAKRIVREFELTPVKEAVAAQSDLVFLRDAGTADAVAPTVFDKYGLTFTPKAQGDFFTGDDTLMAYFEAYNLKASVGEPVFLESHITFARDNKPLKAFRKRYRPELPEEHQFFLTDFALKELPSGTYILNCALKRNNGEVVLSNQRKFFLVNDAEAETENSLLVQYELLYGYPEAQLDTFLRAMRYLVSDDQWKVVRAIEDSTQKKMYFYNFWERERQSKNAPGTEWFNYLKGIRFTDKLYRTQLRPGWASDRGRILLTYGPPSDRQVFQDPMMYEIWIYDRVQTQSGVMFVFSASERASNEYLLIHSTLQGEVYNEEVARNLEGLEANQNATFMQTPIGLPGTSGATRQRSNMYEGGFR